jgi:hypothetical protein
LIIPNIQGIFRGWDASELFSGWDASWQVAWVHALADAAGRSALEYTSLKPGGNKPPHLNLVAHLV